MLGNQPVVVLKEGTSRERGRSAQASNIMAAVAVAEAVRTSLGPKGMDKMLVDSMGDVVVTNDGATLLKKIDIQHPAAKMVVEVAKTQERQAGDGSTSAVVLAGALLQRAEALLGDVHPTLIARGYRLAQARALEALQGVARTVQPDDEKTLLAVARTAMSSKASHGHAEELAQMAVRAVRAVAEPRAQGGGHVVDLDHVLKTKKTGGSVRDSELIEGVIVDKERAHPSMPARVEAPRIALLDCPLEIEKPEVSAKIQIRDPAKLNAFLAEEERILREAVERIKTTGANVVLCQKGIDDLAQHFLAKAGIYAVRRVKESDLKALARATGARIVSDLKDLAAGDLGQAARVEERRFGDDRLTFVTGCTNARSVSLLLRGGTQQVVDELERTLDDALGAVRCVVEEGAVVPGAGAPEIEAALALRTYAASVGGREQLAVEAYAEALESLPRALAENAGHDAIDALVDLRAAHGRGERGAGLDAATGRARDSWGAGVVEPLRVKRGALTCATDVATMILRIDDVIAAKPPEKDDKKGAKAGKGHL